MAIFLCLFSYLGLQVKPTDQELCGNWLESEVNGSKYVECPYRFEFGNNKTYRILNVCYGSDPQLPITEDGIWSYDSSKKIITLTKRKAYENELFHDSTPLLSIHVKELQKNFVIFYFESPIDSEKLIRIKN